MRPVDLANYAPGEIASPYGPTCMRLIHGALDPVASLIEWSVGRHVIPASPIDQMPRQSVGPLIVDLQLLAQHIERDGYAGLVFLPLPPACVARPIVFH